MKQLTVVKITLTPYILTRNNEFGLEKKFPDHSLRLFT